MGAVLLLLLSFAVILVGALVFTNAVEWAGHRLELGRGRGGQPAGRGRHGDAGDPDPDRRDHRRRGGRRGRRVGAIIGAPFLLATIAMALVGTSALIYRNRREQGTELRAHAPTLERDLVFFLIFFALGVAVGAVDLPEARCRSRSIARVRRRLRLLRAAHAAGRRRGPGGRRDRPALPRPHAARAATRRPARRARSSSSASRRSSAARTCSSRSSSTSPRTSGSSRSSSR